VRTHDQGPKAGTHEHELDLVEDRFAREVWNRVWIVGEMRKIISNSDVGAIAEFDALVALYKILRMQRGRIEVDVSNDLRNCGQDLHIFTLSEENHRPITLADEKALVGAGASPIDVPPCGSKHRDPANCPA